MLTKTYREKDIATALNKVKRDLGAEAIVVSMREVPSGPAWKVWKETDYEVIASLDTPTNEDNKKSASMGDVSNPTPKKSSFTQVNKNKKVGFSSKAKVDIINRYPFKPESREKTLMGRMRIRLLNQGINEFLVNRLIMTTCQSLSATSQEKESVVIDHLKRQLEVYIHTGDKTILDTSKLVVCLVGTRGSGKTSACAKLAYDASLRQGKKVSWICADTLKAGAINEARTYTEPLDIPYKTVYQPEELVQAIEEDKDSDLILVDTPGSNPVNESSMMELGSFLTSIPKRITYLAVSATTKELDLDQTVAAFSPFNLQGYVVTKMDETFAYGNIFNMAWKSQVPLVYFTNGINVIDDLVPATNKKFIGSLFGERIHI